MEQEWLAYHNATKDNPPSKAAQLAIAQFGGKCGQVMDLGCGAGADTQFFLSGGWQVLAVDAHTECMDKIKKELPKDLQQKLEVYQMTFEKLHILKPLDCIIANFSIPFCNPRYFGEMWNEIVGGLKQEGIFAGVFFGNRDDWAKTMQEERTFHTVEEVEALFTEFEIIQMQEEEWDGACCGENGEAIPKHWHIFHVVARKAVRDE